MTTMNDIAKMAGVSQATVSRVLNGSAGVNPEKRALVMEAVRKTGFTVNTSARTLAAQKSFLIGVVVPDLKNPYFTDVLAEIEQYASLNGFSIILANSAGEQFKEKDILRSMRSRQVDGILVGLASPDSPILDDLREMKEPIVMVSQDYAGLDCVSVSHRSGGEQVARHLMSEGIEQFAYFGPSKDEKYLGFRDELVKAGVGEDQIQVIGNYNWWLNLLEQGFSSAKQFLREHRPVDRLGVMAVNDPFALGVVHAAQELGISIPDEISIVGFDDTFICRNVRPMLSSVYQPIAEIGRLSVDMLLRKINAQSDDRNTDHHEQHIVLEPRFVRRETS